MKRKKYEIIIRKKMSAFMAFTLAEVIIVLGIIGILAEITIPILLNSVEKQISVSKVKEMYSIISQATGQINNDCAGSVANCLSTPNAAPDDNTARTDLANLFKSKLAVQQACPTLTTSGCFASVAYKSLNNNSSHNFGTVSWLDNSRFILLDGIAIGFGWNGYTGYPPDLFDIYFDINGTKNPNQYGKDLFYFYYDMNKKVIVPDNLNDCGTGTNNGKGCAAKILQEGAINYY